MDKPTIVVVNGTAGEGYWSAFYLLKTGEFNVRATVRRPDSEKARELRAMGCEVVAASTEDLDALGKAFEGAQGIYGTTIYDINAKSYVHENPQEMAQGAALLEAAKGCSTLEHFVFQTMTRFETHPEDIGQHSPIHFRTKWQLEEMVKDAELPWTMLRQPAYMRQIKFGLRGTKRISYPYPPGTKLVYVAEADIGKVLAQVFRDRERFLYKDVKVCSEVLTPEELTLRASRAVPSFSPKYKQASRLYSAFFDHVIVGFKPAFRYVSQINGNLIVGNCFDMSGKDQQFCADLISPLELATMEDWLQEEVETN